MIYKAPIGNSFKQNNDGDKLGDIWSSRNIDLNKNRGKINTSSPVLVTTISTDADTPQSTPLAFVLNDGKIGVFSTTRFWCLAETGGKVRLFETTSVNGDFTLDSDSPEMVGKASEADMITFNNKVYIATGANLYSRSSSGTWTTVSTDLQNDAHILSVYKDRLYISNASEIYSLTTGGALSKTGSYTLNIDSSANENLYISCMRADEKGLWIGTVDSKGGRAKMFFWDGVTENAVDASYKVNSIGVVAMTIKDGAPFVIGSNGVLFRFNGSAFKEIDKFDFEDYFPYSANITSRNDRFVHPNGMIVVRNEILINVNNRSGEGDANEDPIPVRVPSGIWAWSEETGLYHKHSLSSQLDSDTIKDYGQIELVEAGAMFPLYENQQTNDNHEKSDFFVGYSFKSDNSTTRYAVGRNNSRNLTSGSRSFNQASVFITPELTSQGAKDEWQRLWLRVKELENSTDKIIVKWRKQKYTSTELAITWVNTTSFTTTSTAMAAIKTNFEAGIDYEFEGLQGDGAGQLAHITNITLDGSTYTVTLDETITGATTNTARIRLDRWNKIRDYDNTEGDEIPSFPVQKPLSKIQFKVYLFGKNIEIDNYLISAGEHTPLEN
jgi:hypothetical protein